MVKRVIPALDVKSIATDLRGWGIDVPHESVRAVCAESGFVRGLEMFRRVVGRAGAADSEGSSTGWLAAALKDFNLFVRAQIARASGRELSAIADQLGDARIASWLRYGQVPETLFDRDPLRGERMVKPVMIPTECSGDFAYVCGAHAGTRRRGVPPVSLSFRGEDPAVMKQVVAAAVAACGLGLTIRGSVRSGRSIVSASTRSSEFLGALYSRSAGNTQVPWEHVQTGEERRAFLRGFFDFSGGSMHLHPPRFNIGRRHNPELLEDVAILLKREGVLARVSYGSIPMLHIESRAGLEALQRGEFITVRNVRARLEEILSREPRSRVSSPAEYAAVMVAAKKVSSYPEIQPGQVRAILQREHSPYAGISADLIRKWVVAGHVPSSVVRMEHLKEIEARRFPAERCAAVGAAIVARQGSNLNPTALTRAIAEFWGGASALADRARMPAATIEAILAARRIPSRAEYRFILDTVGLALAGEIEIQSAVPHPRIVEQWLDPVREVPLFRNYQAAVMIALREAFSVGADLPAVAKRKIHGLAGRGRAGQGPTSATP